MNKRKILKLPEQVDAAFEKVCEAVIERACITATHIVKCNISDRRVWDCTRGAPYTNRTIINVLQSGIILKDNIHTGSQMTITDAARQVLSDNGTDMSTEDIFKTIVDKGLYEFKAKDPVAVLKRTLRQRSNLIESPKELIFKSSKPGHFSLAD